MSGMLCFSNDIFGINFIHLENKNTNIMKTIVIGASPNESRYSYKAVRLLKHYGHEVIPVGIREGMIDEQKILTGKPTIEQVHTVTLYVGIEKQNAYYDYIFSLYPKRIIFNPGTENDEFAKRADSKGIETITDCTLVMLNSGRF
jgi:predicted CoA-binding protein